MAYCRGEVYMYKGIGTGMFHIHLGHNLKNQFLQDEYCFKTIVEALEFLSNPILKDIAKDAIVRLEKELCESDEDYLYSHPLDYT